MPGKPSQIQKQADSLGIWHKVSIAMRRPRSGRGAYFGIGPRRDLCTSLPGKRSRALWPSATTRGLRATWSGWKARKNERTTTRSLRRNSPASEDDTHRRASWLWEGSASFLCQSPCPVGPPFGILTYPVGRVGVIHPSAWGSGILRSSHKKEKFCEVRGSKLTLV